MREQYRHWVYPKPISDMRKAISSGGFMEIGDPTYYWPLMWSDSRRVDSQLNVLCAGCGSNQAAYYACMNPNWNVLGIDVSDSSLSHQQSLKDRHALSNLELLEIDLTEIAQTGRNFDFITCTGVLHHLHDPDKGLQALASVLRPDGILNIMVYGKHLRMGVYPLQEAFRLMRLEQTSTDVSLIKAVLQSLPQDHPVNRYIHNSNDLNYDAGIVDTFLNPVDQAYSVKEIFSFTRRSGLEFLNWCEPAEYSLRAQIPEDHPLWSRLGELSSEQAAHVCDLLLQSRGTHRWMAAHPDYVAKARIPFDSDALFAYTFRMSPGSNINIDHDSLVADYLRCSRGNLHFKLPRFLHQLIEQMDVSISIRSAMESVVTSTSEIIALKILVSQSLRDLYEMGHVQIFMPNQAQTSS
jgi:SAM-dependent methyltransferase